MIQFLLFRPLFDALHQYKHEDEGGAVWQQHGTEIPWQPFVPVASRSELAVGSQHDQTPHCL